MTNEALNHINFLIKIAQDFLNNKIDIEELDIEFEDYYVNHAKEIFNYSQEIYEYLDNIRMGIDYYEADPEARDLPCLLDEDGVRKETKRVLDVLADKYNLR